ncbi:MAG: hypothetical protein IJM59_08350 [Proteobacteria bacterium]|nr:hypothetical protein [Pseudomonadota bacterium]
MRSYLACIIAICAFPVLTAQVPYEYFVLQSIVPPEDAQSAQQLSPEMPSRLMLDDNTGVAGDLKLMEPFAPPVGIYKRRKVFTKIEFDPDQNNFALAPDYSDCTPWHYTIPSPKHKLHRSALIYQDISAHQFVDIPGDSPEMLILSFDSQYLGSGKNAHLKLYRCTGDQYVVEADEPGIYRIAYETVSYEDAGVPKTADFFVDLMPDNSRTLPVPVVDGVQNVYRDIPRIHQILQKPNPMVELIRYFQAFQSEPLDLGEKEDFAGTSMTFGRAILEQEKGLCRHRSFMLMLIANSLGFPTRIAANEIHAFIEIFYQNRWYPVELGGRAQSLTISSADSTLPREVKRNYSFSDVSESSLNGTLSVSGQVSDSPQSRPSGTGKMAMPEEGEYYFFARNDFSRHRTRDEEFELSGRMLDGNMQPIANGLFLLKLSAGSRSKTWRVRTDAAGELSIRISIDLEWPLGETQMTWHRIVRE